MIFWDKEKKLEKFIEFTRRSVNALYYSDDAEAGEGVLNQIEAIISLVEAGMLEQARLLIDDVEFSDIQVQLFCICAIASNGAEEDLQALRELIEFQRDHGDDAQTSLFLFIFFYSRSKDDLRQLRARIKRADPFGQVHSYLALFQLLAQPQYLELARQSASLEVPGRPFFRNAGLVMMALFTSDIKDFNKIKEALVKLDELAIRVKIPRDRDIDVDKILARANDFQSAFDAVDFISDEYLRAMVWTLIGASLVKRVMLQVAGIPIIV